MSSVYDRVCAWNAARYEQEYHGKLLSSLLTEEYTEMLDAKTEVEYLDALCDLQFVALGGMWKLDADPAALDAHFEANVDALETVEEFMRSENVPLFFYIPTLISLIERVDTKSKIIMLQRLVMICQAAMVDLGFGSAESEQAMLIVCDSNDSKSIQKTDAHVKANKDKGPFFVAPEPRLQALLDSREVKDVH